MSFVYLSTWYRPIISLWHYFMITTSLNHYRISGYPRTVSMGIAVQLKSKKRSWACFFSKYLKTMTRKPVRLVRRYSSVRADLRTSEAHAIFVAANRVDRIFCEYLNGHTFRRRMEDSSLGASAVVLGYRNKQDWIHIPTIKFRKWNHWNW